MLYGVEPDNAHQAFIGYECPVCEKRKRYPNTPGWKTQVARMKMNKEPCGQCKQTNQQEKRRV